MTIGSEPGASSHIHDEKLRLRKLADYRLTGSPEDPRLARLARLTARHFNAPIALITAVGSKMTWCVASYGPSFPAIPRDRSICSYAIKADGLICIPDLQQDERFAKLARANDLHYYAGAPLLSPEGYALGALCIMDRMPRPVLDAELQQDLIDFSLSVMDWLNEKLLRKHRDQAEKKLQDNLALLDGVLENTSQPIFVKDTRRNYIVANRGLADLVGVDRQKILGMTTADLFDMRANQQTLQNAANIDYEVMRTGREHVVHESLVIGPDKVKHDFRTLKTPLRDARGTITGVVTVAQDITDMLKAERALRASEARFRAVVEHAPQLMWVNHVDGSTNFFNAAWRAYTGENPTDAERWAELHPDDIDHVRQKREHALKTVTPYEFEMRIRRHDGIYRRHLGRVAPLIEGNQVTAWIGVATDIDDIYQARLSAIEADRARSRFLASASHDLRQPMQSILLFAGALRSHVETARGVAIMDRLQQGLDTLKSLLDDLIELARLDAGMITPIITPTLLPDILGALEAAHAPVAAAKGLTFEVHNNVSRPLLVDPLLLSRMLRALIENAVAYTEKGSVIVSADAGSDGWVRLSVTDTGMGIPPDQRDRIFDELHQVHNSERDRERGLGLGLSVVRRLSSLLDHPVEFETELNRGSCFTLRVPLPTDDQIDQDPPVSDSHSPTAEGTTHSQLDSDAMLPATVSGRFAVIVEDDPIVSAALDAMLRDWGFDTLVGSDTDEAMAALMECRREPDLVLVDYRLRADRVGTEAVLRIRELFGAHVPAMIITGEIGSDPARDAMLHGLALMHKPVTPRMLAEFISNLFGRGVGTDAVSRA